MRSVLSVLSKEWLHLKSEKFEFHCEEVKYLVLIIGQDGVKIYPAKVAAV